MHKYCHVFAFILVYVLWYLVNEVKCAKNDLEFWKPDRKFKTKSESDESDYGTEDEKHVVVNRKQYKKHVADDETENKKYVAVDGKQYKKHVSDDVKQNKKHVAVDVKQNKKHVAVDVKQDKKHVANDVRKQYSASIDELRRSRAKEKKKNAWLNYKKEQQEEIMKQKKANSKHKNPPMVLKSKESKLKNPSKPSYRNASIEEGEFISPRPKLRHRFGKKLKELMDSENILRSTRMPPNYELQQLVDDDDKQPLEEKRQESTLTLPMGNLSSYNIARQLLRLGAEFPDANITHEIIGRTIEYNDIVLLKVSKNKADLSKFLRAGEDKFINEVPAKKIVFIVHGLSVMGFNSMFCFWEKNTFKTLVSYYFKHLDLFDIFLIPMANPDGVALKNLLWNKNNSPQIHCHGVSLDRNFDVAWNGTRGLSSCNQQYPGPTPFSELETQAIRDVFHRYSHRIIAYLHVHAGVYAPDMFKGDAVLYPKGYSDSQTDDDKYIDLKGEIDELMKNASFRVLSVAMETLHNWYGPVAGASVDYASSIYGIPYAMEAVFQQYQDKDMWASVNDNLNGLALTEIWQRVFEAIFNHIWKNSSPSNDGQ